MTLDRSMTRFPTVVGFFEWLWARLDRSRPVREVVAAAGLPVEVAKLVLHVTRATGLWRREQREVARELCAHFQDAAEAGRTPAEMTESFGNVRRAARLIRKAKRRGRPVLWKVWAAMVRFAGVSACVLVAAYLWVGYSYWYGLPTYRQDFVEAHNRDVRLLPPEERAWPLYREALLMRPVWPVALLETNNHAPGLPMEASGNWPDIGPDNDNWDEAVNYNRECAPMLQRVREAARRDAMGAFWDAVYDGELSSHGARVMGRTPTNVTTAALPRPTEDGPQVHFLSFVPQTYLGYMRSLARDLAFDVRLARHEKDAARWLGDIETLLRMGEQIRRDGTDLSVSVGHQFLMLALEHVGVTLERSPEMLSSDQWTSLAHRLAIWGGGGTLHPSMNWQTKAFQDTLQGWFTDDGHGNGVITQDGMRELLSEDFNSHFLKELAGVPLRHQPMLTYAGPAVAATIAGRAEQTRVFQKLMDLATADMNQPLWERPLPSRGAVEYQRLKADPAARLRLAPVIQKWWTPDDFTARCDLLAASRDGLLAAIACELFHRREARYPLNFAELPVTLLPAAPVDPWTGAPMHLLSREGKPLIYSVGPDRTDDGGKTSPRLGSDNYSAGVAEGGKHKFSGFDWVVWPRRRSEFLD